jgi:hypothetical protein
MIIKINGINERFKKDNIGKTSAANVKNEKANTKPFNFSPYCNVH